MTSGIHVLGAGGHAKVVIATLRACGLRVAAAWDDAPSRAGTTVLGVMVLGPVDASPRGEEAVLAIGSNEVRARLGNGPDRPWATVIHPAATVHESARLGPGTVVFAGAVVQPDAVLGRHVIVNTGASVDHDCRVGDFAHIAPGARLGGGVEVGTGALVGIGSTLITGVVVGAWSTIGAGSAVIRPVPERGRVAGCPARAIRQRAADRE